MSGRSGDLDRAIKSIGKMETELAKVMGRCEGRLVELTRENEALGAEVAKEKEMRCREVERADSERETAEKEKEKYRARLREQEGEGNSLE